MQPIMTPEPEPDHASYGAADNPHSKDVEENREEKASLSVTDDSSNSADDDPCSKDREDNGDNNGEEKAPLSAELERVLKRMVDESVKNLQDELQQMKEQLIASQNDRFDDDNDTTIVRNNSDSFVNIVTSKRETPSHIFNTAADLHSSMKERFDADAYVKSQLFVRSTHRYLFMDTIENNDGTGYEVRYQERLLAVCVILFQFITYYSIGMMGFNEGRVIKTEWAQPRIEVDVKYCYDEDVYGTGSYNIYETFSHGGGYESLGEANITTDMLVDLLRCSSPADWYNNNIEDDRSLFILRCITATLLLSCFLIGDVFESFVLFNLKCWRAKVVSIVILLESAIALHVSFMGVDLTEEIGMMSSFLLFVGLIFVHDADEQLGYMQDVLHKVKHHFRKLQFKFWIFAMIFFGINLGSRWYWRI